MSLLRLAQKTGMTVEIIQNEIEELLSEGKIKGGIETMGTADPNDDLLALEEEWNVEEIGEQLEENIQQRKAWLKSWETPRKYQDTTVSEIEYQALKKLEEQIGEPIPKVNEIKGNIFGFITDGMHVAGIGLYKKGLRTLPETLDQLTNLQTLTLYRNKLTSLPEALGHLTNLQTLILDGNQLTSLPETIGQLTNLQELDLTDNQLTSLPETLGKLTNLKTLFLERNKLRALPETLENLTNLQWLDLQGNQLASLPETLGQLTSLRRLDLMDNQLVSLPDTLGQLANLQELDLRDNQLTSLPETLKRWLADQRKKGTPFSFLE